MFQYKCVNTRDILKDFNSIRTKNTCDLLVFMYVFHGAGAQDSKITSITYSKTELPPHGSLCLPHSVRDE